jgi:hypothetical protein
VDVSIDGQHVRRQSRGEGFGEIALLRDTPRTATVAAVKPTTLIALDRDAFLTAVTGHPGSVMAGEGIVTPARPRAPGLRNGLTTPAVAGPAGACQRCSGFG